MADKRLIEIRAGLLAEVHQMRVDNNEHLDRLETQTAKNNVAIGEFRVSVMRLADKLEGIYHLDQRVQGLENIVLPKLPLQAA